MKKYFQLLSLLFVLKLASCSTLNKPDDSASDSTLTSNNTEGNTLQVDDGDHGPFVVVSGFSGYNSRSKIKLRKAINKVNEVIHSQCFEEFMIDRSIKKTNEKYVLHSTNGRTAKEVVSHLRSSTTKIKLIYYRNIFSKVVGYTYPNTNKIWTNWNFYAGATTCNRASNLAHEASHKPPFSYGHDFKATRRRPWSVPYSINEAFKVCCK